MRNSLVALQILICLQSAFQSLKEQRDNAAKIAEERAAEATTKNTLRDLERRRVAAVRAEARSAKALQSLRSAETRPRGVVPRPTCAPLTHPPKCCFLLGAPIGFFSVLEPTGAGIVSGCRSVKK